MLINRLILGVQDPFILTVAVLHDVAEDTEIDLLDIQQAFGEEAGLRIWTEVLALSYPPLSPDSYPSLVMWRYARYRHKWRRVRTWNRVSCLVCMADMLDNLFLVTDQTVPMDPVVWNRKRMYFDWAVHMMVPAIQSRLQVLGWTGPFPSGFIDPRGRYLGPTPIVPPDVLQRLDLIT